MKHLVLLLLSFTALVSCVLSRRRAHYSNNGYARDDNYYNEYHYKGTNSASNTYRSGSGGDNYHYSNRDGSYYYKNSDGSSYYKSADGDAYYTRGDEDN